MSTKPTDSNTAGPDTECSLASGDLLALLRAELSKAKDANVAALNLLSVLAPIDWDYVFSAPGNGQQNAQRVKDAMKWLEDALS